MKALPNGTNALWLHYFGIGILYGTLPATMYGYFIGFRGVDAKTYTKVRTSFFIPWTLKFIAGWTSDNVSFVGLRRKPCIYVGWTACTFFLALLSVLRPLFRCSVYSYSIVLTLVSMSYILVDVSVDALMIELAKKEVDSAPGRAQSLAYTFRTLGSMSGTALTGLFMNTTLYGGSMTYGITFEDACLLLSLVSFVMVCTTHNLEESPDRAQRGSMRGTRDVLSTIFALKLVSYQIFGGMLSRAESPAIAMIKKHWAKVEPFHACMSTLIGNSAFVLGLQLGKKVIGIWNWRVLILVTQIVTVAIDAVFQLMTIFAVIRNPFFYSGETFLTEIPDGILFLISTQIIVQITNSDNAGLTFSVFTSCLNLGKSLGVSLSNVLLSSIFAGIRDGENYMSDTSSFRLVVGSTVIACYVSSFLSLFLLSLVPKDRRHVAVISSKSYPAIFYYICILVVTCISVSYWTTFSGV